MYFQLRGKSYSFLYYDPILRKNIRLPKSQTPHITSEADAIKFAEQWDLKNEAFKARLRQRINWEKKYPNFEHLLMIALEEKKQESPYAWKNFERDIRLHVYPFFLGTKQQPNINLWKYHLEEFRSHLHTIRTMKGSRPIAYTTKNNILSSLNGFLKTMYRHHYTEYELKVRRFPESLANKRTADSVINPEMANMIHDALHFESKLAADFFWVILNTGMRLNEAIGLSLDDFHAESIESDFMQRALKPYNLNALAYIALESQPLHRTKIRNARGVVERKPLKAKKKIDPENSRIIPIFDKRTYNILAARFNEQKALYDKQTYGDNLKNYLLFDGLSGPVFAALLKKTQKNMRLSFIHTAHDTRHTYSTWLADQTAGNYTLCRMILGHSDLDMTMRYVHINSKLRRQLQVKRQIDKQIELVR